MIAAIMDWVMRAFERRAVSPVTVQAAARVLERIVEGRLNTRRVGNIQNRRLRDLLRSVQQRSPFYQELLQKQSIDVRTIRTPEDLGRLPFTTSKDIREWRRFLCVPENQLAAVYTTSGTTGEPKRIYFTFKELQLFTNFAAAALCFRHPGPLVVLIALPMTHGLWIGASFAQRVVERAGGLPLPIGAEDPCETLKWMQRFEPNVAISSPSYLAALTRQAERQGYRQKLDRILLSGEALTAEQKQAFHDYWQAQIVDSYGTTEIGGSQTLAFADCTAFHLNDLHLVTEIIDPETGKPADEGELVFTTLLREAMPLVRYRSGDRAAWATCNCGLPFRAVRIAGRTDDMMVAGDMNLYGNIIADAVGRIAGANSRLAIVIDKVDLTDRLTLRVEGNGLTEDQVKQALIGAYPEVTANLDNGNLLLRIEPNVALNGQLKALKIQDTRLAREPR